MQELQRPKRNRKTERLVLLWPPVASCGLVLVVLLQAERLVLAAELQAERLVLVLVLVVLLLATASHRLEQLSAQEPPSQNLLPSMHSLLTTGARVEPKQGGWGDCSAAASWYHCSNTEPKWFWHCPSYTALPC